MNQVTGYTSVVTILLGVALAPHAAAAEETFRIDGDHTHIVWQVDRFGFSKTVGTFTTVAGTVVLDVAQPERSRVEASIALSGLRSDLAEREHIVRGPHWLDADAHPTIRFTSTSVAEVEDGDCEERCLVVVGDMSLKGVSAPLTLEVAINRIGPDPVSKRNAAGFSARGAFTRSDFGITTAVGPIGDEVSFTIEALAVADEDGDKP